MMLFACMCSIPIRHDKSYLIIFNIVKKIEKLSVCQTLLIFYVQIILHPLCTSIVCRMILHNFKRELYDDDSLVILAVVCLKNYQVSTKEWERWHIYLWTHVKTYFLPLLIRTQWRGKNLHQPRGQDKTIIIEYDISDWMCRRCIVTYHL